MSSAAPKVAPPTADPAGTAPRRVFIKELGEPPQDVAGDFAIINKQLGSTRDQKKYFLKCLIGDKSGQMPARMWTIDEATYTSLPTDGFVYVEGQTQAYQGEVQFIINRIRTVEPTAEQMRDLLPCSARPADEIQDDDPLERAAHRDPVRHFRTASSVLSANSTSSGKGLPSHSR